MLDCQQKPEHSFRRSGSSFAVGAKLLLKSSPSDSRSPLDPVSSPCTGQGVASYWFHSSISYCLRTEDYAFQTARSAATTVDGESVKVRVEGW